MNIPGAPTDPRVARPILPVSVLTSWWNNVGRYYSAAKARIILQDLHKFWRSCVLISSGTRLDELNPLVRQQMQTHVDEVQAMLQLIEQYEHKTATEIEV